MSSWHIDEKIRPPIGVNIQKFQQLERETCLLGTNCNKDHPLPKLQLLLLMCSQLLEGFKCES
jgi:hypothetical protein